MLAVVAMVSAVLPYDVKVEYDSMDTGILVSTGAEDVVVEYDDSMGSLETNFDGEKMVTVPAPSQLEVSSDITVSSYMLYSEEKPSLLGDISSEFMIQTGNEQYSKDDLLGVMVVGDFIAENDVGAEDVAIIVSKPMD